MIGRFLRKLVGRNTPSRNRVALPRIFIDHDGPIYAVGDVHGHLGLLQALEEKILADGANNPGDKLIVMVGDLIDRGPRSAQVLDHCLARMPEGWRRLSICGNHEITMLDALADKSILKSWLGFGGVETLASYGIGHDQLQSSLGNQRKLDNLLQAHVPSDHLSFLKGLPVMIETPDYVFTHAGINPNVSLGDQSDDDLMWYQGPLSDTPTADGRTVVHGHVVAKEPVVTPGRINVDIGAYATGRLCAARLLKGQPPQTLIHERARVS